MHHALALRRAPLAALVLATALAAGCGGGGGSDGSGSTGTLRVSLTDAPACGYEQVNVTVEKVRVHASSSASETEGGWHDIAVTPPRRVNLLTLANGVLLELGQTALPAGRYQQIRLVLSSNAPAGAPANSVVPTGAAEVPLDTPSGQTSGLKLATRFDVPAGSTADVVLDFDACRSVVRRGNSGRYNLKPVVSVVPMIDAGAVSGYVEPSAVAAGALVSAQAGGVVVKSAVPAADGAFRLSPVPAGTYDVVFTASGRTTRVVRGVPVTTGSNAITSTDAARIALPSSPTATLRGTVGPVAARSTAWVRALQTVGAAGAVEIVSANADADTGGWSMVLPTADAELASWGTGALPLGFTAVAGSGGRYSPEAAAAGYATVLVTPPILLAPGATVTRDFTLVPAP